jgi:pimeloyl-ACP methyl ester carboxylesterase
MMTLKSVSLPTGVTLEYALSGPGDAPVLGFVHGLGAQLRQFLPQEAHF